MASIDVCWSLNGFQGEPDREPYVPPTPDSTAGYVLRC